MSKIVSFDTTDKTIKVTTDEGKITVCLSGEAPPTTTTSTSTSTSWTTPATWTTAEWSCPCFAAGNTPKYYRGQVYGTVACEWCPPKGNVNGTYIMEWNFVASGTCVWTNGSGAFFTMGLLWTSFGVGKTCLPHCQNGGYGSGNVGGCIYAGGAGNAVDTRCEDYLGGANVCVSHGGGQWTPY